MPLDSDNLPVFVVPHISSVTGKFILYSVFHQVILRLSFPQSQTVPFEMYLKADVIFFFFFGNLKLENSVISGIFNFVFCFLSLRDY